MGALFNYLKMKALQSISNFLTGNRHDTVSENLKSYTHIPDLVFAHQQSLKELPQTDILWQIKGLKNHTNTVESDDLLIAIFAAVAEGFNRIMGISPYPEQLIAASAMADKNIIEMQTGEGKTIAFQ